MDLKIRGAVAVDVEHVGSIHAAAFDFLGRREMVNEIVSDSSNFLSVKPEQLSAEQLDAPIYEILLARRLAYAHVVSVDFDGFRPRQIQ